ncbi:HAD-IA family hydrolase [Sedimentitalea arenosa]|uniref:HAD-IA family hydrolase n=1 Tax=Sedimentitalea arenosa TaxID=2798803 RepID=A0A8J7JEQ1_9RHOB|nr:HAD-IA family hydrolase [Arenibacterium arenosum]MBJ6372959.1 HAD-IA family hydrolase [Arenibacterium arenosum]
MTDRLRLVIFDVDGTLVDSQASILGAMAEAFAACDLPAPDRAAILGIVGLSLDHAMARLVPDQPAAMQARLVAGYKDAFHAQRLAATAAPLLYPGARAQLDRLAARDDLLLGVATGKSQRGLDALLEALGMEHTFVTRQVADHHPSKPHPSMLLTALAETGVDANDAVMIGDTTYDMDMARAARVTGIGVSWGYHAPTALTAARRVIDRFDDLPGAIDEIWEETA